MDLPEPLRAELFKYRKRRSLGYVLGLGASHGPYVGGLDGLVQESRPRPPEMQPDISAHVSGADHAQTDELYDPWAPRYDLSGPEYEEPGHWFDEIPRGSAAQPLPSALSHFEADIYPAGPEDAGKGWMTPVLMEHLLEQIQENAFAFVDVAEQEGIQPMEPALDQHEPFEPGPAELSAAYDVVSMTQEMFDQMMDEVMEAHPPAVPEYAQDPLVMMDQMMDQYMAPEPMPEEPMPSPEMMPGPPGP